MEKKILTKATSETEEPTPGWMFHHIASTTKKSPQACEETTNWLMKRLTHKNAHVKKKVLLIIKSVAQTGDAEFARIIIKRSEEIKQYANFRGEKDPLHGDALNQSVRTAASQAIEAIFERNESGSKFKVNMDNNGSDNNVGRIGTVPTGGFGFGGGIGSSDHYGNDYTHASDSENRPAFGGGFGPNSTPAFGGGFGSNTSNNSSAVGSNAGRIGSMTGIGSNFANEQLSKQNQTGWTGTLTNLTNYLPSWSKQKDTHGLDKTNFPGLIAGSEYEGVDSTGSYVGVILPPGGSSGLSGSSHVPGKKLWETDTPSTQSTNNTSIGDLEIKVVNEFTSPGGIRKPAPTKKECTDFAQKCSSLNILQVAELLNQKLDDHEWIVRLKALHGIEALLKTEHKAVSEFYSENCENILKQSESVQESVRQQAEKVAKLLNFEDDDNGQYGPTLLEDFGGMSISSVSTTSKPARKQINFTPSGSTSSNSNDASAFFEMMNDNSTNNTSADDDIMSGFEVKNYPTPKQSQQPQKIRTPTETKTRTQIQQKASTPTSTSTPTKSSTDLLDLDALLSAPTIPSQKTTIPTPSIPYNMPVQQPIYTMPTYPMYQPYPGVMAQPGVPMYPVYQQPYYPTYPNAGSVVPNRSNPPPIMPKGQSQAFDFINNTQAPEQPKEEKDSFDFVKQAYLK